MLFVCLFVFFFLKSIVWSKNRNNRIWNETNEFRFKGREYRVYVCVCVAAVSSYAFTFCLLTLKPISYTHGFVYIAKQANEKLYEKLQQLYGRDTKRAVSILRVCAAVYIVVFILGVVVVAAYIFYFIFSWVERVCEWQERNKTTRWEAEEYCEHHTLANIHTNTQPIQTHRHRHKYKFIHWATTLTLTIARSLSLSSI